LFLMMTGLLVLLTSKGSAQDVDVESDASDTAQAHLDLLLEQCEHELVTCIMFEAMYMDGEKLSDDDLATVVLHHQACDSGSLLGCNFLGLKYRNGDVVVHDEDRAERLFALACGGGELRACHNLTPVEKEQEPPELEQELPELEQEQEEAAPVKPTGSCMGCNCRGLLGEDVAGSGSKTPSPELLSEHEACFKGDISMCYNLGLMYLQGNGVAVNEEEAISLFKTSCAGGEMLGCTNLGTMYAEGKGVPRNDMQAVGLYHQACKGGEMIACHNLAGKYDRGEGVVEDHTKAASYYRMACNSGDMRSCTELGMKYAMGEGVAQNNAQAAALFNQACMAGEIMGCDASETKINKNIKQDYSSEDILENMKDLWGFLDAPKAQYSQTITKRIIIFLIGVTAWFFMYRRFSRGMG